MSKINYVVREDGIPEMFVEESEFGFMETYDILKKYPYIKKSMDDENYHLENETCYAFDEIVYENKVVGFATFEANESMVIMLTECYILPEFRGKRLFFDELSKMIFSAPSFGILQPTRNIVELLCDYSFARKVSDDIVVSGIEFYFDSFDVKSNKRDEIPEFDLPASNFYDLGICSTVFADGDEVIYHCLLENDLRKYGARGKLDDDYFTSILDLFSKNNGEFMELVAELKKELPHEKLDYDTLVGNGNELSDYMMGMVDSGIMSHDRAFEIKKQLTAEYELGQITDESIDDRLNSLIIEDLKGEAFESFNEFMDSSDVDDEDFQIMKEFFDAMGDNEELKANIFGAILSDDPSEFENLIYTAMNNDEKFSNKFMNFIDDYADESLEISDDSLEIINSLDLNMNSPYPVAEMMWGRDDEKHKLDDTFYGKDYPISHENYVYRVLNSLKKQDNLRIALESADMKGSMTSHAVESLLFMQDFIKNEVDWDNWDDFAHNSLTVSDLKNILRENNLKVSGKKQELIDRIAENQLSLDSVGFEKTTVTPEGEQFIEDNSWIGFYYAFLDKFDFNDFSKYLDENEGDFIDITLKYVKQHCRLAKKEGDSSYISDCSEAYELISKTGEDFLKQDNGC